MKVRLAAPEESCTIEKPLIANRDPIRRSLPARPCGCVGGNDHETWTSAAGCYGRIHAFSYSRPREGFFVGAPDNRLIKQRALSYSLRRCLGMEDAAHGGCKNEGVVKSAIEGHARSSPETTNRRHLFVPHCGISGSL